MKFQISYSKTKKYTRESIRYRRRWSFKNTKSYYVSLTGIAYKNKSNVANNLKLNETWKNIKSKLKSFVPRTDICTQVDCLRSCNTTAQLSTACSRGPRTVRSAFSETAAFRIQTNPTRAIRNLNYAIRTTVIIDIRQHCIPLVNKLLVLSDK